MTDPILGLSDYLRERVVQGLETGQLGPPYSEIAVNSALGGAGVASDVCAELVRLHDLGISSSGIAYAIRLANQAEARTVRPDLVWSGPEVRGLHARDTRRVFEELIGGAESSLWISSFAYYDGPRTFELLAARMDENPSLQVTLLLNIQRKYGDEASAETLVRRFADALWEKAWPGARRPAVFYDPRSLESDKSKAVLHAKAVVADVRDAFVTSANLTEKAFDENIEVGVLTRDTTLAESLVRHFRVLIDEMRLSPLPVE